MQLAADGLDTYVGGVSAYSTLGWFDDPILSTFIDLSEADFIELLIHELSHSRIWAKDDVPFNEAFASFVGREGARVWFARQGRAADFAAHLASEANWGRARTLLEETRAALEAVYQGSADEANKRAAKARVLETAAGCLEEMSQATGIEGYRRLVPRLNNAYLASLATYSDQQGAFAVLFADAEGVWADFFMAAEALAGLAAEQRGEEVEALLARSSEQEVAADGDDARPEQVQCEALTSHGLDRHPTGAEDNHVFTREAVRGETP
jgi:predicted aminopeptidase